MVSTPMYGDGLYLSDVANSKTDALANILRSTDTVVITAPGYVQLVSAAAQPMYFDCGTLFTFRDKDGSNATRMTLDSSNGALDVGKSAGTPGNFLMNAVETITNARVGKLTGLDVAKTSGAAILTLLSDTGASTSQNPKITFTHAGSTPANVGAILQTLGTSVVDNLQLSGPSALNFTFALVAPSTKDVKQTFSAGGGVATSSVELTAAGVLKITNSTNSGYIYIGDGVDIIQIDGVNDSVGIGGAAPTGAGEKLKVIGKLVVTTDLSMGELFHITPGSAPGAPGEGDFYFDSADHKLKGWDGSAWQSAW